jgi:hypothetical protein
LRAVVDVGADEATLFVRGGVVVLIARVGCDGIVVVVAPFCEVVCEFEAGGVGGGVFEVDDDELLVAVGGEKEGGFAGGLEAEDVAVLGLVMILVWNEGMCGEEGK